jgi:ATP adenylyltransferase
VANPQERTPATCDICRKHRGEGPLGGQLIGQVDGFWVYHAPPDESGLTALGYLYIESDRHAGYLADLTDEEAEALGRLRSRLAAALRETLDPELVLAAVIGRGQAHFHEHLFCRHRGTPDGLPWHASDEAAPRVDLQGIAKLVDQLKETLEDTRSGRQPARDIRER